MAINVYCGLQGSGKSFEVISSVILDAVLHGRRVVTNVDGINEDRIHEYLVNSRDADPEKLGNIIHVANDQIMQPYFFPDGERIDINSVVQGGDLVAVDEAWRFWGTDNGKLSHEHMQFFRMHRHYVHPQTAVACDVALMTQDISGLHRSVKNVVEFTFRMQKHKSLGLSKRYRVDIHEGWKVNLKTRIDTRQKSYDAKIFPLYQSYAGGQGKESAIDKRQNIFGNKTLWFYIIGFLVLMIISGMSIYRFFHSAKPPAATSQPIPQAQQQIVKSMPDKPSLSDDWRIVGFYEARGERWVVISDREGRLRVESPSAFYSAGASTIGDVDGQRITKWSGAPVKSSLMPEVNAP